ncbi:MAG: hypothetical protein M0R32_05275 [Candidatus Cloacimonetes bacterium]|jgi:hypothetical protein|nr:hypothetical protein [Candidatus Cloacimonadota bacterium]
MSGIFVDEKERIEIKIDYKLGAEDKVEILEKEEDGSQALTVKFAVPDYQTSQRILQSSMRPATDGGLTLDLFAMQQALLIGLAREWDVKDSKGKDLPLTATAIGTLKVEIARALIAKLMDKVGMAF